ncbi:hypothetical protein ACFWGP_06455 [Agromyces sp. NPDC127015]|uniref:hypothetical protein n=1 Tax=Agromyces sp. NPDC127015 TaxID=3347108 RepID=UPI003651D82F
MGFLRDLATLTRQGYEAQQRLDVGASMAQAKAQMEQASRMMAASMPAQAEPALEGQRLRTTATILDARQLPMMIGMNSLVELDLHVLMPGGVPLPVTRTEQLAPLHLARALPGATLDVSLVPGRPDTVHVEWGG